MDPLTHGVASFALQRAFFPRLPWRIVVVIIGAGVVADVDSLSAALSPTKYLQWHRTATHSLLFVFILATAAFLFARFAKSETMRGLTVVAVATASLLHLFLDIFQCDSLTPFWPVTHRRVALDVLPSIEPWLLTILVSAIVFPELFRLVSDEIGARSKQPRGRNGAIVGLTLALLYLGLRALLHANTIASLEAHTIAGETPHRVGAFPDSTSPFIWHSIVETESALNLVNMRSMGGEVSYASSVTTLHKPELSPMLAAAQGSDAAVAFVRVARFPKATVQSRTEGSIVEVQDLRDQASEEKSRSILAEIKLDKNSRVVSSELLWLNRANAR